MPCVAREPRRSRRAPRMEPLARLPIFLALDGRRAMVAGDGPAVAWKAELLSAAGAGVVVFAKCPCEELHALAAQPPRGAIVLQHRAWQAEDFCGAAVAVAGFDADRDAQHFADAARAAGVPVNVIDKPAYCDFSFGAIVNRSPLVIGISTDGAAPVFAQAIRGKLEAMIPRGFAGWADAAERWRKAIQSSGLSFAARRRFWQAFARLALAHSDRAPAQSDFDSVLRQTRAEAMPAEAGSVTFVGAGPGNPELLTLRAVRALQSADVILIDDLVAPDILDFARREARKMLVGDPGHSTPGHAEDVNATMVALAKSGKRVVWLKHGDAAMLGRAGSEIATCRAAGVAVEIVPGVAAAPSAGASMLLERFLALAANRRQRDQDAERQRGDQEADADRPL
jgi:uroporphyrin-III C-methyltransferase/precorrin-2 dehydrogenase/sirohydrochlorin ferrochelatase